jgi:hypothetical protein
MPKLNFWISEVAGAVQNAKSFTVKRIYPTVNNTEQYQSCDRYLAWVLRPMCNGVLTGIYGRQFRRPGTSAKYQPQETNKHKVL